MTYDPFVSEEQAANGGSLLTHYQAPLLDGNNVYMEFESGTFDATNARTRTWSEKCFTFQNGQLVQTWSFASDWFPEDPATLGGWEPVFHAVLTGDFIYVPGVRGTVWKLNKMTGAVVSRITPTIAAGNTYVSGPLSADSSGNVFYNAIRFHSNDLFAADVDGSWLVKIATDEMASVVPYSSLVANAPTTCQGVFATSQLPWPPSPDATPSSFFACGSQRPGINVAPAIGPDGTIYTVSRAHFTPRYSFMIAVNSNLTPKWSTSMRMLFNDGCGVLIPIQSAAGVPEKGKCNFGAHMGVDPATNHAGEGRVLDQSSSSPTVLPDGNVLYGGHNRYNVSRGHLMKFNGQTGALMRTFDFGWDSTPAIYSHGGTYSIVIKDNHYDEEEGFYCNQSSSVPVSQVVCAFTNVPAGPFYITQLSADLTLEWSAHNVNTLSCNSSGSCTADHPNGFEWCINAPAVDGNGTVFANSEDGNLYVIPQGNVGVFPINTTNNAMTLNGVKRLFTNLALGAAYTPLAIAADGKIYTENDGILFVVGQ